MRATLLLCLFYTSAIAADPCVVVVDSIEVNEIVSEDGSVVFRQVWYLEWDTQREGGEIQQIPVSRGWRRCNGVEPVITEFGAVDWYRDGDCTWQVWAPVVGYSTTRCDPEVLARESGGYRPIGGR